MKKTLRDKIKYIINNYGQSTSEGGIHWYNTTNFKDRETGKKIITGRYPLDCIVDEILELFDNKKNER